MPAALISQLALAVGPSTLRTDHDPDGSGVISSTLQPLLSVRSTGFTGHSKGHTRLWIGTPVVQGFQIGQLRRPEPLTLFNGLTQNHRPTLWAMVGLGNATLTGQGLKTIKAQFTTHPQPFLRTAAHQHNGKSQSGARRRLAMVQIMFGGDLKMVCTQQRRRPESADAIDNSHGGGKWRSMVLVDDRIADSIFQQIQTRPQEYSILATLNLNGDYISDAAAAMVGGLGMAPGANIGENAAIFEATHGTAPKHAGLDRINPGSVILSGVMMLEFLGWQEAADLVTKGLSAAIADKQVTYDLARLMEPQVDPVSCSGFAEAIIQRF